MRTLATIEGDSISWDGNVIEFTGHGRIDDDGTGSAHGDPDHQAQTSLKRNGAYLNADVDHYIVVPPQVVDGVESVVLGSQAYVTYRENRIPAVVGDVGPHKKLGEISMALARALGINDNPNSGGDDNNDLFFEIYPGLPATVNGTEYELQAS